MIKGARLVLIIILSFFILNFSSAAAINDNLHLNVQAINSSGDIVTGTFNFTFNISTTSDCANVVFSNLTTLTTDSRGIISYYLENTNLNYSDQYWLCYYRNNVLIDASKIARNPYTFYANNSANWQGMNNFNATQSENSNNLLNIKESWLSSFLHSIIDPIFTKISSNVSSINTTNNIQTLLSGTNISQYAFNQTLQIYNTWNTIWSTTFNQTYANYAYNVSFNWTAPANSYTDGRINSVNTTGNIQQLINSTGIYSTPLTINTTANIQNLINGTNMKFGNVDFNNGWTSGGASVIGGSLFAQTLYVYNISSLNVNNLVTNGSSFPAFDNSFDLGNATFRWKNIFASGDIRINGTLYYGNGGIPITALNSTLLALTINTTNNIQTLLSGTNISQYAFNQTIGANTYTNLQIGLINTTANIQQLINSTIFNSAPWNQSGTNIFPNAIGNNVGIGTSSPTAKLNVIGDVIIDLSG